MEEKRVIDTKLVVPCRVKLSAIDQILHPPNSVLVLFPFHLDTDTERFCEIPLDTKLVLVRYGFVIKPSDNLFVC